VIEQEGIRRSIRAIEDADFVIALFDGSGPLAQEDFDLLALIREKNAVAVISKADLPRMITIERIMTEEKPCLHLSTVTYEGVEELKKTVVESNIGSVGKVHAGVVVTNVRHKTALDGAAGSLNAALALLAQDAPLELFAIELRDALGRIGEITGVITTEEILDRIFSNFCIGK
jgi:tRNA modification GTPase